MVRLVPISGKKLCKIIEKLGFEKIYGKGSHVRFKHLDGRRTVAPNHKEIKTGTLKSILELAEVAEDDFVQYT